MNITLDDKFFDDKRITRVSLLAGECLATAAGRLVFLWRYCSRKRTDTLTAEEIEVHSDRFGDGQYAEYLALAKLADKLPDGTYRIKGVAKRIKYLLNWDEQRKAASARGGSTRAALAERDASGKYLPKRPGSEPGENQVDPGHLAEPGAKTPGVQPFSISLSSSPSPSSPRSSEKLVGQPGGNLAADRPAKVNGVGVWNAYSAAYESRWGVAPVRHQVNNTLAKKVAEKLGMEDAPKVAAFYLTHPDRFYVGNKHPLNLLLRDADRLYTEWKSGRIGTFDEAAREERRQTNINAARDAARSFENPWEEL